MARTPAPIDPELIGRVRSERLRLHDIQALTGAGRDRAQRILDTAGVPAFPTEGYVEVPVWSAPAAGAVVDIIPSKRETAQWQFVNGDNSAQVSFCLRSHSKNQPLWRSATYLGTDIDCRVQVRPILGRAIVADGSIRPRFADKALNKAVKRTWKAHQDFIADHWGGFADVVIVGDRLPSIDLPLGWSGGIQGVRHVFLDDLLHARVFNGVPTAEL